MGIYIWGTGCSAGDVFLQGLDKKRITAFIDNYPSKETFLDKPVLTPKQLNIDDVDLILVSSKHTDSIRNQCSSLGINPEKLFFLKNNYVLSDLNDNCTQAESLLGSDFYHKIKHTCHVVRDPLKHDNALIGLPETEADYVRFKTLELITKAISNVNGAIAELGVYRGNFSRIMNQLLPERTLYLFDSFEGFHAEEAVKETKITHFQDSFLEAHKNTNVHQVVASMPYPEKIIVHQGYFPESLHGLEERFALVSLDVDFEDTTYEGLNYFWPRLNTGGYLMLHDYNSPNLCGVKRAVERYEKDYQTRLPGIPLCDINGTFVFCKV